MIWLKTRYGWTRLGRIGIVLLWNLGGESPAERQPHFFVLHFIVVIVLTVNVLLLA